MSEGTFCVRSLKKSKWLWAEPLAIVLVPVHRHVLVTMPICGPMA